MLFFSKFSNSLMPNPYVFFSEISKSLIPNPYVFFSPSPKSVIQSVSAPPRLQSMHMCGLPKPPILTCVRILCRPLLARTVSAVTRSTRRMLLMPSCASTTKLASTCSGTSTRTITRRTMWYGAHRLWFVMVHKFTTRGLAPFLTKAHTPALLR